MNHDNILYSQKRCGLCGAVYFKDSSHSCEESFQKYLDKHKPSPGLEKLRKQMELTKNGMKGTEAHVKVFHEKEGRCDCRQKRNKDIDRWNSQHQTVFT